MEGALDLGLAVMTPEKAMILKTFPFREHNFFDEAGNVCVVNSCTMQS
jgi:hypothetical protein